MVDVNRKAELQREVYAKEYNGQERVHRPIDLMRIHIQEVDQIVRDKKVSIEEACKEVGKHPHTGEVGISPALYQKWKAKDWVYYDEHKKFPIKIKGQRKLTDVETWEKAFDDMEALKEEMARLENLPEVKKHIDRMMKVHARLAA